MATLKPNAASLNFLKTDLTQVRGAGDNLRDTTLAAIQDIKSELAQNQNTRATLQATLTEVQNTVATLKTDAVALESLKTDLTQVRGAGDNLRDTTLAAIQDIKSELAPKPEYQGYLTSHIN